LSERRKGEEHCFSGSCCHSRWAAASQAVSAGCILLHRSVFLLPSSGFVLQHLQATCCSIAVHACDPKHVRMFLQTVPDWRTLAVHGQCPAVGAALSQCCCKGRSAAFSSCVCLHWGRFQRFGGDDAYCCQCPRVLGCTRLCQVRLMLSTCERVAKLVRTQQLPCMYILCCFPLPPSGIAGFQPLRYAGFMCCCVRCVSVLTTDCVHLQERVLPWCYKFAVLNACASIGGRVQRGSSGQILVLKPVLQPVLAGVRLCRVCVLSLVGWSTGLEGWKMSIGREGWNTSWAAWPVLAGVFAESQTEASFIQAWWQAGGSVS